ncbi:MAG: sporulation protein YqfD [Oscillospiraceae bacterium]|jgi:similar to stage IV sporulation protein|nr:sporulation protein YqfD [Oscillospiraceae bacterium]
MFIIRLIRFLRGYICFTASDGFPERFLNLCNQAGVVIWDVGWKKGAMTGRTDRHGYALMQTCADPAGIQLTAQRKVGLPFLLRDYRRRAGMLAGLAVCVAVLSFLSGRIWTIEVTGNRQVETVRILAAMEQQGVRLGARRKLLNSKTINASVLRQLPGLSWISLNLRGSSAVIEVREELPDNALPDNRPQDIVARKAGQLRILEIYSGKTHAGVGEAVLEGALLAGGEVSNADASTRYVHAVAYAVARTGIVCESAAPRAEKMGRVSFLKTHYTLYLLNLRVPLGRWSKQTDGAVWTTKFTWRPGARAKSMPLALEQTSFVVYEPKMRQRSDSQLRLTAAARFFDEAWRTLRAAQVLRQEVRVDLTQDECAVSMTGSAFENIGEARLLK